MTAKVIKCKNFKINHAQLNIQYQFIYNIQYRMIKNYHLYSKIIIHYGNTDL